MTKHTSAHLKILVGPFLVRVFCQNKESKLSANIFHQKNILMKQGVIRMSHINIIRIADRKNTKLHIQSRLLLGCEPDIRLILL